MNFLPIDDALPELLARLREASAVVLRAPTGAGKTTRVPPALLPHLPAGKLLLLEPRRVAARAAARRMADEDGTRLGDRFGYHVRFDKQAGRHTRCVAVTPGILLRNLLDDPFLEDVACVVFDEFHERGIDADLALGMVRLLRTTVRPDLKLVVMSATLDVGAVSAYLGDCPVVTSEGRTFPVEIRYRPRRTDTQLTAAVADAVREAVATDAGDVLAFLPGLREIRETAGLLNSLENQGVAVLPLHGDLPPEQQDAALRKFDRRKVVLATNVAETSVTVDGVTVVVDSGVARQMEFDAAVGMDRLRLSPISKASADQRAGRAGRTQPGACVRLWDELGHRARPDHTDPEIRRVDVCGALLQLLAFGESDVRGFPWFDPPKAEAVAQGLRLLELLGAVRAGSVSDGDYQTPSLTLPARNEVTLTPLGRRMADLPVHPRLARMLIAGAELGIADRAALAAALISERDPFLRDPSFRTDPPPTESDVLDRVEALEEFDRTGRTRFAVGELHRGGAKGVLQVASRLNPTPLGERGKGEGESGQRKNPPHPQPLSPRGVGSELLFALFTAYPDRLAKRRTPADRRAKMVGGRGVKLAPQSGVNEPDLFVCVDVDAGTGAEAFVRQASGVRREWLPSAQLKTGIEVLFDESAGKIVARKQTRFADLVIDDTAGHFANETEAARVLAEAATARWDRVRPPDDTAPGAFLLRVRCLREWLPDADLPDVTEAGLQEMLPDVCRGLRSLEAIRNGHWLDQIRGRFSYKQLQFVDAEAPERLEVPTGSEIKLEYAVGKPPVLAVRIQELFGLTETPRIARGTVKVLLHLLSPNYRPQQVTDDLASFWANGYPLVRKELRARYPKHSWPDDPATAAAVRGPKKRG